MIKSAKMGSQRESDLTVITRKLELSDKVATTTLEEP